MNEYKIKWGYWCVGILAIPIVVWIFTLIPMPFLPTGYVVNETHWVAFFGGYTGACFGALMTLYVMRKTLWQSHNNLQTTITENRNNLEKTLNQNQENHKELVELQNETNLINERLNRENKDLNELLNREQRRLQINTIRYTQEQRNIEKLREVLDENYKLFDFQKFAIVLNYIKLGNTQSANQLLLNIIRDVEMFGAKTDLYLSPLKKNQNIAEKEYGICFKNIMIAYGVLTNDFIFILSLFTELQAPRIHTLDSIKKFTQHSYDVVKSNSAIDSAVSAVYNSDNNIFEEILHLQSHICTAEALERIDQIIYKRLEAMVPTHQMKIELAAKTQALLIYKENEAEKLLLENKA